MPKTSSSAKFQARFKTPERERFAAFLDDLLDDAASSTYALGSDLGSPSMVHRVRTAVRPIPVHLVHQWARRLGLKEKQAQKFMRLALVAKIGGMMRKTYGTLGWNSGRRRYDLTTKEREAIFTAVLRDLANPKLWSQGSGARLGSEIIQRKRPTRRGANRSKVG